MAGAIIASIDNDYLHVGIWIAGVSPLSLPASAPVALLSLADSETMAVRPIQGAARFGWIVWGLTSLWLVQRQRAHRAILRSRTLSPERGQPDT
jgi:hypothetical protein